MCNKSLFQQTDMIKKHIHYMLGQARFQPFGFFYTKEIRHICL